MFFAGAIHHRWLRGLLISTLAALVLSNCGGGGGQQEEQAAEEQEAPEAALDAALEQSFEQSGAPGVVAAVQTPEYTWVRALGVADRISQEPMTPEVYHRIGSVNKSFTVTLLLQAEDEGLLSLDDTIDRYFEGVPNGDKIALSQMASMNSGIADYGESEQFEEELTSDPQRVWKPEELVQLGIENSPLFDPGTEYHYSNTNIVLLGLVLEQVTGEPIDQLYRERIIEPLGLEDTSFPEPADTSLPDPHDRGYTFYGQPSGGEPIDATNWSPSWSWAAGAMISTVDDLLAYGRALGTGEGQLSAAQQDKRLGSFVSDVPPLNQPPFKGDLSYGIGLMNIQGWVGHSGNMPGYTTYLFYHPDLEAVMAVEVNTNILAGDCPEDMPTFDVEEDITCAAPTDRVFRALAEALGQPAPVPAQ